MNTENQPEPVNITPATESNVVVRTVGPRAMGAFSYAAMIRAGAYVPADAEMVAAKFEALGIEIERLTAQRDRFLRRLQAAGLSTPFEALNGDEQREEPTAAALADHDFNRDLSIISRALQDRALLSPNSNFALKAQQAVTRLAAQLRKGQAA